ncbi:MAG: sulfoxide reductase heme-binding subunit YedZ [Gammaproteobacteria bacterium]|nr:sulfoxide reductase heme-binding subunit YedZ [Gammaproteobacteria bacterium]
MPSRNWVLFKTAVFSLCLLPLGIQVWRFTQHQLGANPIEVVTRHLGEWALMLLLITLCMSPLKTALQSGWPIRLRRMLGLFGFFYALLHLLAYVWMDQFFDWPEIGHDILKRPFITVGMLAFGLLIPLALTSTQAMQRRLKRNWVRLHRLIYVIVIMALIHFFWLVKADTLRPIELSIGAAALLLFRVVRHYSPLVSRQRQAPIPTKVMP